MTQRSQSIHRCCGEIPGSVNALVVTLRARRGVSRAAGHGGTVERHTLNPAAEELGPLGGQRAGVDAHPGDLGGEAAVLDLRTAVHYHLKAAALGELGSLFVADAE